MAQLEKGSRDESSLERQAWSCGRENEEDILGVKEWREEEQILRALWQGKSWRHYADIQSRTLGSRRRVLHLYSELA
jgi:hypothetical protein